MLQYMALTTSSELLRYILQNHDHFPSSFLADLDKTLIPDPKRQNLIELGMQLSPSVDSATQAFLRNLYKLYRLPEWIIAVFLSLFKTNLLPSALLHTTLLNITQSPENDIIAMLNNNMGETLLKKKEEQKLAAITFFSALLKKPPVTMPAPSIPTLSLAFDDKNYIQSQIKLGEQWINNGDLKKGISFFDKVSEQLEAEQLIEIGKFLEQKKEGHMFAEKYYATAASKGNGDIKIYAFFCLAKIIFNYRCAIKPMPLQVYKEILTHCKAAADQYYHDAELMLATIYIHGLPEILPFNIPIAIDLLEKASNSEIVAIRAKADSILIDIYINLKEYTLALKHCKDLLTKSTKSSHREKAITILGWLYEKGYGCKKDPAKAQKYYDLMAQIDNHTIADAEFKLGVLAYKTGLRKQARDFFKNARDCRSLNNLGVMYATGTGVRKDIVKAGKCFRKAAQELLFPAAMRNLAIFYAQNELESPAKIEELRKEAAIWSSASGIERGIDQSEYEFVTELSTPSYVMRGNLLNQKIMAFEVIPVPICEETCGDCGFMAIGIDRVTAIEELKKRVNDETTTTGGEAKFTKLIAAQIYHDLLSGELDNDLKLLNEQDNDISETSASDLEELLVLTEFNKSRELMSSAESVFRESIATFKSQYEKELERLRYPKEDEALLSHLLQNILDWPIEVRENEIKKLREAFDNYKTQSENLLKFCKNKLIVSWYLDLFRDTNTRRWLPFPQQNLTGLMNAIVELHPQKDKGICVWEIAAENRFLLKHWYKATPDSLHILFTGNNHFAGLTVVPSDLTLADLRERWISPSIAKWVPSASTATAITEPTSSTTAAKRTSPGEFLPKQDKSEAKAVFLSSPIAPLAEQDLRSSSHKQRVSPTISDADELGPQATHEPAAKRKKTRFGLFLQNANTAEAVESEGAVKESEKYEKPGSQKKGH